MRKDVAQAFVNSLLPIKQWFESQAELCFYASSLLLVYEAYNTEDQQTNSVNRAASKENCQESDIAPLVDVRMIDFAHVFPTTKRDDNYLIGLNKLISDMKLLSR